MAAGADREARKALMRLRRSMEKAARELEQAERWLRDAEGGDFPADVFDEAARHLHAVGEFIDEQAERLQARILEGAGLDPARLRRGPEESEGET